MGEKTTQRENSFRSRITRKERRKPTEESKKKLKNSRRSRSGEGASDFDYLRGPYHRIGLGDLFPAGGLVVEGAVVGVGVAVTGAEEIAAPAPESRQPHPPPAARAPPSRRRSFLVFLLGLRGVGSSGAAGIRRRGPPPGRRRRAGLEEERRRGSSSGRRRRGRSRGRG